MRQKEINKNSPLRGVFYFASCFLSSRTAAELKINIKSALSIPGSPVSGEISADLADTDVVLRDWEWEAVVVGADFA